MKNTNIFPKNNSFIQELKNENNISFNYIYNSLIIALSKQDNSLRTDVIKIVDILKNNLNEDNEYTELSDENFTYSPTFFDLTFKKELTQNLPTKIPTEAPIKWANRATFVVDEIKDEYTLNKLKNHPKLESQIREAQDALTFFNLVWQDYVTADLMYYIDLKGQQKTKTLTTPKSPLDKTLADVMWKQCKAENKVLSDYLPNKIKQLDKELNTVKSLNPLRLRALAAAKIRRSSKTKDV